jgi:hypothetical protein
MRTSPKSPFNSSYKDMVSFRTLPQIAVYCFETGETYLSMRESDGALGLWHGATSACINGRFKQSGGYTFRLATEQEVLKKRGKI